ncbi:thioredoxin family protein [Planctomicrobium piriforme]|uniref:Thioredoxin n=1 Tax=Planctomicrobium piriforme TaxID=1576369 RepID=A0A1I3QYI1_9PLAN|nr:thioredoxin domain-containing protein [Planctomicrobium piriforme]SFJ38156.1 thioredoxin [Planctomicrobium piriforme]
MERLLLLIGAVLILVMLAYSSLMQHNEPGYDLAKLSEVRPSEAWFQKTVLDNPKPVLVEFGAAWCGPCKQLAVVLRDIEKNYGEKIDVVKIDIDEKPDLADLYGIDAVPVLMVFQDGKVVEAERGLIRFESVEQLIQPYLEPKPVEAEKVSALTH